MAISWPLRRYMASQLTLATLIPLILTAVLVWLTLSPLIRDNIGHQNQSLAQSVAGQISERLSGAELQLRTLASITSLNERTPIASPAALLDTTCARGEIFETIYLTTNHGSRIKTIGLAEAHRSQREDFQGIDISKRHYQQGRDPEKISWSTPFRSMVNGRLAIALLIPIGEDLLIGEITLENLSDFLGNLPIESGLKTMVWDNNGRVIADSEQLYIGQQVNSVLKFTEEKFGPRNLHPFQQNKENFIGSIVTMENLGWKVQVSQPSAKVFQPVRTTLVTIGVSLLASLLVAGVVSLYLSTTITAPVQAIISRAKAITQGQYIHEWPKSKTIEIQELTATMQAMAREIQKREHELAAGEKRLRELTDNVPGVVIQFRTTKDHQYNNEFLSASIFEIFGLKQDSETVLEHFFHCIPSEDQPRYQLSMRTAIEQVSPWHYEGRFIRPDGKTIWFQGDTVPKVDGETIVYYGVLFDITRQKNLETSLRLAKFCIEKAAIGIFLTNQEEGTILEANDHTCQVLDYSKEEILGINISLIDQSATPERIRELEKVVLSRGAISFETSFRRKNGDIFPVQLDATDAIFEGEKIGIVFFQDIAQRKMIESSLRLTQFSFDKAAIAIFYLTPEGNIVEINEWACSLLGYSRLELLSMTVYEIDLAFTKEMMVESFTELRQKHSRQFESSQRKKDGEIFPVEVLLNYTFFEGQELCVAFVQDIRERRQWEKHLKESERRYRSLFNEAPMLYVITDSSDQAIIRDVNATFLDRLGYGREEVLSSPLNHYYRSPPKKSAGIRKDQQRQKPLPCEEELITSSGEVISVITDSIHEYDEQGKAIGRRTMFLDNTERKKAEAEINKLRTFLTNFYNSMPSVLIGVDPSLLVTQWNHGAERYTGTSFEEAALQPLFRVFPRLEEQRANIILAMESGKQIITSKIPVSRGDKSGFEDITIYPILAGKEGAVIRIDDVTQRVNMEEMMIQNEKMLSVGGLAAGMAHEINNPLAGLLQNIQVLESRLLGDLPANRKAAEALDLDLNSLREYIQVRKLPRILGHIQESGRRISAIVRNMLSFARKSEHVFSSHSLSELLDQTLELAKTDYDMKKEYDFKKITINKNYLTDTPVPCEKNKIQQVFLNILKNGAEAMAEAPGEKAPVFSLLVAEEEKYIRVEIEDNGPGLLEGTRKRIFEPFFTTKTVGKGTGLGLSVSYYIITDNHGGKMQVKSRQGRGTTFLIHLPKKGQPAIPPVKDQKDYSEK